MKAIAFVLILASLNFNFCAIFFALVLSELTYSTLGIPYNGQLQALLDFNF